MTAAALLCNDHRNLALEVARGERSVVFVALEGERYMLRKVERETFDRDYYLTPPTGSSGVEPTPRRFVRACLASPLYVPNEDALAAMLSVLALEKDEPRPMKTCSLLVETEGTFLGAYENADDARLVQRYLGRGVVVRSPADLTEEMLAHLHKVLAPSLKTRSQRKLAEGIFEMATKADKPAQGAPKKVEKTAKERVAKKDGPIAKVKEFVAKHQDKLSSGAMSRAQARQALLEQGINKTTVSVQLQRWLTEFKITAQAGGRVKKGDDGKFVVAKPKEPKAPKAPKTPKKVESKPAKTTKTTKTAAKPSNRKPKATKAEAAPVNKAAPLQAP